METDIGWGEAIGKVGKFLARRLLVEQELQLTHPRERFGLGRFEPHAVDETLKRQTEILEKRLRTEIAGCSVATFIFRAVSLLLHAW